MSTLFLQNIVKFSGIVKFNSFAKFYSKVVKGITYLLAFTEYSR